MKVLVGMSASFCNIKPVLDELLKMNYDFQFVCSPTLYTQDSRFISNSDFLEKVKLNTKHEILHTIQQTELLTFDDDIQGMILAPCTTNTLAKLVNGIYDNGLLLACKVMLRNHKPIVIGFASNDGLGIGAMNIAKALQMKNIYFVPFGQDDYLHKENSLVCDWSQMNATFLSALEHKQLQPILVKEKR